jgi:hypothetical protein
MKEGKKVKACVFSLFFVIALTLVLVWFDKGLIIASGESGPLFYNPAIIFQKVTSSWILFGTGMPQSAFLAAKPFLFFLVFLNELFPSWLAQQVVFFLLLLLGLSGFYFLVSVLFKNQKFILLPLLSSIFYLFNLYVQTQVWQRLLFVHFFAWSFFPWFLGFGILFLSAEKKAAFRFLLLFLFSSVIFSYIFVQPVFVITFWAPLALYWLIRVFSLDKPLIGVFKFLFLLTVWVGINFWWVYPDWVVSRQVFYQSFSDTYNLDSLVGVSQYFPTSQILLLRQSFLLGKDSIFYNFYSQPWIIGVSVLILMIVVLGIFTSIRKKYWLYLITLLLVGWFISKGSNPPFGYSFYQFLFSTFPFTAILRNPFEKFGLVFVFSYTIFFALGIEAIYKRFKLKIRQFLVVAVLVLCCGVLVWPMWTGVIYQSAKVKPPKYYSQANKFLSQFGGEGRILMLPMIAGDGVKMSWGYGGIEPSEFLFDRSAVSKILRTKYYDNVYWDLYKDLNEKRTINSSKLKNLNISFLILRKDLQSGLSDKDLSLSDVRQAVSQNQDIKFLKTFGDLEIYEFTSNKDGQIFEIVNNREIELSYEKLGAKNYKVDVKNVVTSPFNLVFKSTYNNLWEARIGREKLSSHFLDYGYANGWKINQQGSYTIDVVFKVWPWE